ncbi:MAG: UDP-N-acetylmuramoyl-tripeptide--D-alanyl-D-alanine ligase [Firmicutes bacterium]|nr:UDP-N-acetylmuramoyl-tripeptide--D-alanyl-D-alanine ligase [Bacillota bacterium]
MKVFTIGEIRKAINGTLLAGDDNAEIKGFAIDSRLVEPGNMFFPTKGARVDAHDFIGQIIEKGCTSFVVSNPDKVPAEALDKLNVIVVEDTLKALQNLSVYYLNTLPLKYRIGVTGSVGKTSTRDMMYYVSSTKYKTGRNKKNYNSQHGLPLSILDFEPDIEVAIMEMSMDSPTEISYLCNMVRPDIGILTNIAAVNLEMMGNLENIFRGKMEITTFFDENSTLVVNSSCPMLTRERVSGNYNVVTVGKEETEDYLVKDVEDFGDKGIKYTLCRDDKSYEVELPTPGAHNAINASLALAVGELIGIDPVDGAKGLLEAELTGKRLKLTEKNGVKVIDDTYNACDDSVKSGINTLVATEGKRKVAIIGDIIGLADKSAEIHYAVGKHAGEKGVDLLIAVGPEGFHYAEGAKSILPEERVMYFPKKEEFIEIKDQIIQKGDVVLVKASRGMALETIVDAILEDK